MKKRMTQGNLMKQKKDIEKKRRMMMKQRGKLRNKLIEMMKIHKRNTTRKIERKKALKQRGNNKEELARVSPEATEIGSSYPHWSQHLVKKKGKIRRQTPLYFRTRKSTRIKQGKPQTSTKIPIDIEDSPPQRDKMPSPKSPITYVRRPNTRSTSSKGKEIL